MCTSIRSGCAACIPASASRTTLSGSLISFFIASPPWGVRSALLRSEHEVEGGLRCEGAQDATDERADDRDPRVLPVGASLAGDRQDRVDDAGPQVAGGVDRVARRSTERESDAE